MRVTLRKRNFTEDLIQPDVDFTVDDYSRHATGGPRLANIRVRGSDHDLWEMLEKLRCPVEISTRLGDVTWFGYLAEIAGVIRDVRKPARPFVRVGVNIETMRNRVAVAYIKVDGANQERDTTAWADDLRSQGEYGVRELLMPGDASTATHAELARDTKLDQDSLPRRLVDPAAGEGGEGELTLVCRGWWDTVGWKYHNNASESLVDTATQVYDILVARGQFFYSVFQDVTSGLAITEFRDGDATALYEAEQLLGMGTDNGRRMLVELDEFRRVRIFEEPEVPLYPHSINSAGDIFGPVDEPLRNETCPAGIWVRKRDIIPATVDTSFLADPDPFFIEEMRYIVADNRLVPRSRGDLDPWQFPTVRDG